MAVDPRPVYRQVAARIRDGITQGEYQAGSMLPTEDELAERLGTTRAVVNRALRILRAEGLVRAERGKGTTVTTMTQSIKRNAVARYQRAARERASGRGAFDSEIKALGMTPRSDLTVEQRTPPASVAQILGIGLDTPVAVRARRMFADDTPVQLADSYIPLDIADGTPLMQQDSGPGGIISRFAELGLAQARITERINVRAPTDQESAFLNMESEQRVYEITHTGWTSDDRPVEVCVHVMPTHLWELDYEWPCEP
jgi:GntR family transcriptional regulator